MVGRIPEKIISGSPEYRGDQDVHHIKPALRKMQELKNFQPHTVNHRNKHAAKSLLVYFNIVRF
jgi:hypothetical protein